MKSFLVSLMSFLIILGYSAPVFAQINNGQAQTETCSAFSYLTISKSDSGAFRDGWRDLFNKDRALFDQLSALGSPPNPAELNDIMRATCWRYGNGSAEDFIRNVKNRTYEVPDAAQTQSGVSENTQSEKNINEKETSDVTNDTALQQALKAKAQAEKEAEAYRIKRLALEEEPKNDTSVTKRIEASSEALALIERLLKAEAEAIAQSGTDINTKQAPDLDASLEPLEQAAEREAVSKPATSGVNETPSAEEKTDLGAQDTATQEVGLEPDSQVERETEPNVEVRPESEIERELSSETENETEIESEIEPTPLAVVRSCGNVRDHYRVDKNNLKTIPELAEIKGVSYINSRLMTQAFETVSAISQPPEYDICAETKEEFIEPPNYIKAKAKDECGCTVERAEHSLVYVFYPLDKSQWPRGKAPQIDFEFTEQVAIDGLYLSENAEFIDSPYWQDAATALIVNAHKHRAKIDLAIHIPNLMDWESEKIEHATSKIAGELLEKKTESQKQSRVPLLDRFISSRLDGVTLIIEGYDGKSRESANAIKIVEFVEGLNRKIEGSGLTINLAFDIDLGFAFDRNVTRDNALDVQDYDLIFDDLGDLLVDSDERRVPLMDKNNEVVSDIQPPIVDKTLIFLERPTSRSTEILRSRIVRSFTGKSQSRVLRSIIPVVPPSGQKPLGRIGSVGEKVDFDNYGQFRADVLYFQDNFGGIGFWPAPFVTTDKDIKKVKEIVREKFDKASQKPAIGGLCKFTCLNRVFVIGVISITTVSILALIILSNFYLPIYRISYGYFAVPIMILFIIALLTALYFCDKQSSQWSLRAIFSVLLLTGVALGYSWYYKKVSGPMP